MPFHHSETSGLRILLACTSSDASQMNLARLSHSSCWLTFRIRALSAFYCCFFWEAASPSWLFNHLTLKLAHISLSLPLNWTSYSDSAMRPHIELPVKNLPLLPESKIWWDFLFSPSSCKLTSASSLSAWSAWMSIISHQWWSRSISSSSCSHSPKIWGLCLSTLHSILRPDSGTCLKICWWCSGHWMNGERSLLERLHSDSFGTWTCLFSWVPPHQETFRSLLPLRVSRSLNSYSRLPRSLPEVLVGRDDPTSIWVRGISVHCASGHGARIPWQYYVRKLAAYLQCLTAMLYASWPVSASTMNCCRRRQMTSTTQTMYSSVGLSTAADSNLIIATRMVSSSRMTDPHVAWVPGLHPQNECPNLEANLHRKSSPNYRLRA